MTRRPGESGNIFFTLFGAIALVGVVGVATSTLMRGPVGTVLSLNQRAKIESQLQIARKLAALEAGQASNNCDLDDYLEPYDPDIVTAGCNTLITGGGCLPASVGAAKTDPWGTLVGYCGWDHGADNGGCGGLNAGVTGAADTVLAVVSAGPDRTFQTTCVDAVDAGVDGKADNDLAVEGGDDIVFEWTYEEASEGLGGGLWALKSGDPDAITTSKDVEFASGTSATFDNVTANFGAGSLLDLSGGGLFNLPNESILQNGDCNGANKGVLRRFTNQPANDQEVLQICDGSNWQPVSGAGGTVAGGANGEIQYNSAGVLDGDSALVWDAANNELGIGVNPNNTLDVAGTAQITGATQLDSTLGVTGNTTVGGTLGVTGATSLSTLGTSGLATLNSADVTTNATVGGTLGVTGATSLSTLGTSGLATLNSASVTTTLGVTGATTLGSTLGVVGATDLDSTLNVDGAAVLQSTLNAKGATDLDAALNVDGAAVFQTTLNAKGAADFDTTVNVDGVMLLGANAQVEGGDCSGYSAGAITFDGVNDELLLCSSVAGTKWVTVGTSGGGGGGAGATTVFERNGTVIRSKSPAVYATDDFVFGSTQLADTGDANNDARMFFDKSKGAFRAGIVDAAQWDDASVGAASAAFGNAIASGANSFAAGAGNTASGAYSTALGGSSLASNTASIAAGTGMTSSGHGSIALGSTAKVLQDRAAVIGLGFATGVYPQVNAVSSYGIFMGDQSGVSMNTANTMALLGGRMVIDPAVPATQTAVSGVLDLDVEGQIGAIQYCDETGANCFTAASVSGGTGAAPGDDREIVFNSADSLATDPNFVFTSAGRLGVGTATPVTTSHVVGNTLVTGTFGAGDMTPVSGAGTRMMFIPRKAAFRAGYALNTEWDDINIGNYSFASGYFVKALGTGAAAFGQDSAANANYSFVTGYDTDVSVTGTAGIAMGIDADVTGAFSMALGLGDAGAGTKPKVSGASSFGVFMGDQMNVDVSASNIMALLGGRLVIDPDTTSATNTNVSTGAQQLELDVAGDIGAVNYCDEAGNNCFTASSVGTADAYGADGVIQFASAGGLWGDANFVFTSAGRLGIGTAAPSYEMDVAGSAQVGGTLYLPAGGIPPNLSMAFAGDTDTGFYNAGDGTFYIVSNGTALLQVHGDKIKINSATAQIEAGFGTAANPTYSFDTDDNTGMYRAAADALGFSTAGTEKIRLVSGGALGIGDLTPDATLLVDVAGQVGATEYCDENGANCFTAASAAGGAAAYGADGVIQFASAGGLWGDANFVFTSAGRLGIGTGTPQGLLHLEGSVPALVFFDTDAAIASTNPGWRFRALDNFGSGTGGMKLQTTTDYSAYTDAVSVRADGKVGIGVSDPDELVDIAGNGEIGMSMQVSTSGDPNWNPYIDIKRSRGTVAAPTAVQSGDMLMDFVARGYDGTDFRVGAMIEAVVDGTSGANDMPTRLEFQVQADGAGGWLGDGVSTPELVIKNDGAVGIGVATPPSKFVVAPPASEVIAGAAVVTANACGTVKQISAGASVTTNTTDTFTAPTASYAGCCMDVVNVDTADTITLDSNAKFFTGDGSDVALAPGKSVRVCSDGTSWYQAAAVSSVASSGSSIDGLSDAYTDYTTLNNIIMGRASAAALAAGAQYNLFIGESAGATAVNSAAGTDMNIAIGYSTLAALTSGNNNTAVGPLALQANTIGGGNVAVGGKALNSNVGRQESTALGYSAMEFANSAAANAVTYNTAVGAYALQGSAAPASNTGTANTAIGHSALKSTTNGYGNTAVGELSMQANTTGYDNAAVGTNTLNNNTTGYGNAAFGDLALYNNVAKRESTAVGYYAMFYADSTATGAITYNTALGAHALKGSGTPANNTGTNNTALGHSALTGITSGSSNVAVGALAGDSLTTGGTNILIGYDVDAPANNTSNHLNIGNTIYGDLSTDSVGIGVAAPSGKLHVKSTGGAGTSQDMLKIETEGEPFVTIRSADNSGLSNYMNPLVATYKSRGTLAAPAIVQSGDTGFELYATGYDGNTDEHLALISVLVDGTPGDEDMPGRIEFHTSPDGNGASLEGTTPEMVIKNNGYVGIGTAAPGTILDIYGTNATARVLSNGEGGFTASAASANWWDNAGLTTSRSRGTIAAPSVVQSGDSTMTIWSTAYDGNTWETPALIQFFVDGTPGDGDMPGRIEFQTQADGAAVNPESTTPELVIKNDGSIGINTATPNQGKLEVKGGSVCVDTDSDDNATSCIANESDMRLKKNVRDLDYSVETLMKLRPVQFDWKYDDPEILKHYPLIGRFSAQPHSIGFLAQDVQKLVPEAIESETVGDSEVQYLQLDYSKLVPLMVKAAQEQQGDITALQTENEKLKAELARTQLTLADMQDDIRGLKAHTGYGITRAEIGWWAALAMAAALAAFYAGGLRARRSR